MTTHANREYIPSIWNLVGPKLSVQHTTIEWLRPTVTTQRRRNRGGNGGACPRNVETAGRKYLFAPAIICHVCQLVDGQTSKSLYSFNILMRNSDSAHYFM